ncbi:MAG: hypothetical protein GY832_44455 [Chloroflexi bacterium]|nr:hypothetical protein [Chloroflexota bacterium]
MKTRENYLHYQPEIAEHYVALLAEFNVEDDALLNVIFGDDSLGCDTHRDNCGLDIDKWAISGKN